MVGVPVLVRAGDYPTNLFHFRVPDDLAQKTNGHIVAGTSSAANASGMTNDPDKPIPLVAFSDVPLTTAVDNLARQAGINYLLDLRCIPELLGSNGQGGSEPLINLYVKNVRARELLNSILATNGFVLYENPITTVAMVTRPNLPRRTIDENLSMLGNNALGGSPTNVGIPRIVLDDVPIGLGLENLARSDGTNILIDRSLDDDRTVVSIRWEHLTARQAILALCQNYDFKMVPTNGRGSVIILEDSVPRAMRLVQMTNGSGLIDFHEVPMYNAIADLTDQGEIDYLVDPHYRRRLLGGSVSHPGEEMVSLYLKDTSVDDAFTALLKPRGFVMLDEPVSGISMITSYSHRPYVLDGTLLHLETNMVSGTNGIFHPVEFFNEPVDSALNHLITASGLEIKLAGAATNEVNWAIYLHAKHSTAKQELYAICQACEFEIVRDDDGQVVIRPKTLKHYHHVYIH